MYVYMLLFAHVVIFYQILIKQKQIIMKKLLILIYLSVLVIGSIRAQNLNIQKHDGSLVEIPISSIDSIVFTDEPRIFTCGLNTVTDFDGNIYNTVQIGDQCWLIENLKTTRYQNGEFIHYPGSDMISWGNDTTGAYAWYDNDYSWKEKYGALYNWHAVMNNNQLCPENWRVPHEPDFLDLIDYLGGMDYPYGHQIKSCRQVNSPLGEDCSIEEHPRWEHYNAEHGTDEYGFSILPAGDRIFTGDYMNMGTHSYFWTSTEANPLQARFFLTRIYTGSIYFNEASKQRGYSVRCIRNN